MTYALGTSRGMITKAPLLLIDLETEEGVTGCSYLWCYFPAAMPAIANILEEVERVMKGERVAPVDLWARLAERFALIGVQGIVRMAMSGFDMAAWDALAKAAGLPLATLPRQRAETHPRLQFLRARPDEVAGPGGRRGGQAAVRRLSRHQAPARLSDTAGRPRRAARGEETRRRRDRGHGRLQPGAQPRRGARARPRARSGGHLLAGGADPPRRLCGLCRRWCASSKRRSRSARIFPRARPWRRALAAGACDYVMPDLERIGGVTGWQRAAALAATQRIEMSSHLFPEISVHLLAATPTCHFLEYVDWADKIVEEPLRSSTASPWRRHRPGNGLAWDQKAVEKYRLG